MYSLWNMGSVREKNFNAKKKKSSTVVRLVTLII